jgi:hypothetical protein
MKISTQAKLISTALVALAIAAPVAHAGGPYPPFRTGEGFSFKAPSYWHTATPPVPMNRSLEVPAEYRLPDAAATTGTATVARSDGFDWGDASIGAGAMLGIVLVAGGMGAGLLASRQNRRREIAGV